MADRLAAVLSHFPIQADSVYAGTICGAQGFDASSEVGQLHLMTAGSMTVRTASGGEVLLDEPSVLLIPTAMKASFHPDVQAGAALVCAELRFRGGAAHPIVASLPELVHLPLTAVPDAAALFHLMAAEATGDHCGRKVVLDSLCQVAVIHLLRELMDQRRIDGGVLAGLGDARLSRALVAMHERPSTPWTLESLAAESGMSRTAFACDFRDVVGVTPFAYLQAWRIGLAQAAIQEGRPLKIVAIDVGYAGEAALSRAFRAQTGASPREWKRAHPSG